MRALEFVRSVPRYLAVRLLAPRSPAVATSAIGCLRLVERPPEPLPGPGWLRVRPRLAGICGSDLATVSCQGSAYFSAVTSFPFVLGHEVVGEVVEAGAGAGSAGERVVIEPALGCVVRGIAPPCIACAAGNAGNCVNVASGSLDSGIQTGYCRSTGGAFSDGFLAHASQVHPVPADLADEAAVLVEPLACAIHAVLVAAVKPGDTVLVLGAGSLGLLTLLALRRFAPEARLWVAAKHAHQAALARDLGAHEVLPAGRALRAAVIERTGARRLEPALGESMVLGGADVTFDCVGAAATVDESIRLTRARGSVVLVGMPGRLDGVEGTAIWFQETRLVGAYAYGMERVGGRDVRTFTLALETARDEADRLRRLVTGAFPLERYREAFAAAFATGPSGGVKTVFDLRRAG